jgi:hypothetical protein
MSNNAVRPERLYTIGFDDNGTPVAYVYDADWVELHVSLRRIHRLYARTALQAVEKYIRNRGEEKGKSGSGYDQLCGIIKSGLRIRVEEGVVG